MYCWHNIISYGNMCYLCGNVPCCDDIQSLQSSDDVWYLHGIVCFQSSDDMWCQSDIVCFLSSDDMWYQPDIVGCQCANVSCLCV